MIMNVSNRIPPSSLDDITTTTTTTNSTALILIPARKIKTPYHYDKVMFVLTTVFFLVLFVLFCVAIAWPKEAILTPIAVFTNCTATNTYFSDKGYMYSIPANEIYAQSFVYASYICDSNNGQEEELQSENVLLGYDETTPTFEHHPPSSIATLYGKPCYNKSNPNKVRFVKTREDWKVCTMMENTASGSKIVTLDIQEYDVSSAFSIYLMLYTLLLFMFALFVLAMYFLCKAVLPFKKQDTSTTTREEQEEQFRLRQQRLFWL
jgi:hypothetical protein